jgi:hypothetical protein
MIGEMLWQLQRLVTLARAGLQVLGLACPCQQHTLAIALCNKPLNQASNVFNK